MCWYATSPRMIPFAAGCEYTATFDLNAIKTTGMKRLA
ncbi:hypothetical protein PS720_00624 [Pseudomonas fluorescens]|nr:hypothetical protein SAMN05428951_11570 [Pseudomonas sp. OV546]VVN74274.1 hypothetical protein PS720_00624 [Pseudomonas fluorescens]